MAQRKISRKVDPVLENLRKQTDQVPNLDTEILNIQRRSSLIHSAFLFDNEGMFLLQQFCLLMSSSPSGKLYNGWQEFAAYLNITREQIQCIEYNFKGMQDPTYYVLLAFCQSPDATIDKIIISCQKLSRLDIVNRIISPLTQFIDKLLVNHDNNSGIVKPEYIPRVPLVLRPSIQSMNANNTIVRNNSDNDETSLNAGEKSDTKSSIKNNYGSIVMLTFTKDGEAVAKNVTQVFRQSTPKIGVVILQEQEKFVYSRAEEFVDDCFNQVNYIIPILTPSYINHINDSIIFNESDDNTLDSKYVKYIFSLSRFEYFKNNCRNNRIRCIIPNNEFAKILKSNLHPTLQAWFKESDLEPFINNILLKKF